MTQELDLKEETWTGSGKPFQVVYSVLKSNILEKRLPSGLVLLEGAIADLFNVSRTPVQRALLMLSEEGVIQRFDGRGYIVALEGETPEPLRTELSDTSMALGSNVESAIQNRATWEHLYENVETALAEAMAFGKYRVIETEMASFYGVSRTVVRDVLSRLHEAGLIDKDSRTHWVVGPLTAETLSEYYQIREILEPVALSQAAEFFSPEQISAMLDRLNSAYDRYPNVSIEELAAIEVDLHVTCVRSVRNNRLRAVLERHELPLITAKMFYHYLGMPAHSRDLIEHRRVLELLLDNSVDAACALLGDHLRHARDRSLSRLKLLSLTQEPNLLPFLRSAV